MTSINTSASFENQTNDLTTFLNQQFSVFPLDTPWITLHQDKGHFGRSTDKWCSALIKYRLQQGEDPIDIALQCWIMGISGTSKAIQAFEEILSLKPQVAHIIEDTLLTQAKLVNLAKAFTEASEQWTAPTELNLRGWGLTKPDQIITEHSRLKFAHIAYCCRRAALFGLPTVIYQTANTNLTWLLDIDNNASTSTGIIPSELRLSLFFSSQMASSMILLAKKNHINSNPIDREALVDFIARAGVYCPVRNFKKTFSEYIAKDSENIDIICDIALNVRNITQKYKKDLHQTKSITTAIFDNIEKIAAQDIEHPIKKSTENGIITQEHTKNQSSSKKNTFQYQKNPKEYLMSTTTQIKHQSEVISERERSIIVFFINLFLSEGRNSKDTKLFFETILETQFSDDHIQTSVENFLLKHKGGRLSLSVIALSLFQTASDVGYPLKATKQVTSLVWDSHLSHFSRKKITQTYPSRHAAISFYFPDPVSEKRILSLVPAPMLAAIESNILLTLIPRYTPSPEDVLDEDVNIPKPRKMRL